MILPTPPRTYTEEAVTQLTREIADWWCDLCGEPMPPVKAHPEVENITGLTACQRCIEEMLP